MGNMFDNLGKGLNDFTKQAGKIAGNIGDTAGKITKDVAKGAGKIANDAGKLAGDAGKMTAAVAGSVAQSAAVASGEVSKAADSMAKGTVSIAKNVKDSADKVDLFNSKLRAKAVEDYNNHKNKETADKLLLERQNVEVLIRKFNVKNAEVAALTEATQTQIDGVQRANAAVTGADYSQFSHEEKMQAGLLVNMTLTLAQMINKELELDD